MTGRAGPEMRPIALCLATALAGLSGPGHAQADGPYDPLVLDGCLEARAGLRDRQSCVGLAAAHCLQNPEITSNAGMAYCYDAEVQQWEARLNVAYQALLPVQARIDADNREYAPSTPSAEDGLRAMQRAWTAFRDASCAWEETQWGGGSGIGVGLAECELRITAAQALFLESRVPR